jgi:hypothetical protein
MKRSRTNLTIFRTERDTKRPWQFNPSNAMTCFAKCRLLRRPIPYHTIPHLLKTHLVTSIHPKTTVFPSLVFNSPTGTAPAVVFLTASLDLPAKNAHPAPTHALQKLMLIMLIAVEAFPLAGVCAPLEGATSMKASAAAVVSVAGDVAASCVRPPMPPRARKRV